MENSSRMAEFYVNPLRKKGLLKGRNIFKSSNDFSLGDQELKKAQIELGETEEKKERCLRELRKKLSKDPNIRYRTDDPYLLLFLRFRKFDFEKAYSTMKNVCCLRKQRPELFIFPEQFKSIQNLNIITRLPYTDDEGRILMWINIGKWNPREISLEELMRCGTAINEIISANPKCQINGVVGIWDMRELSLRHFTEVLRENSIPTMVSIGLNFTPWRIRKVLILNTGRIAQMLYAVGSRLLSKKVAERIILLGKDVKELHQYVNPVLLPKELGGELDVEEYTITQEIIENLPYLRYERSFGFR